MQERDNIPSCSSLLRILRTSMLAAPTMPSTPCILPALFSTTATAPAPPRPAPPLIDQPSRRERTTYDAIPRMASKALANLGVTSRGGWERGERPQGGSRGTLLTPTPTHPMDRRPRSVEGRETGEVSGCES